MLAIIMCSGCSLAPPYVKPQMELPPEPAAATSSAATINIEWWKNFQDETLNLLIDEAFKNNDDLKIAVVRIEEARALLGLSTANRYPLIKADASASRERIAVMPGVPGLEGITSNFFNLSAAVAYEVDLWGKIKNQRQAALSILLATSAGKDALQLSLAADVATLYFNLAALSRQMQTTEEILGRYKDIYEFRRKQYQHGVLEEIVVQQAKGQYDAAKILLEALKEQDNVLKSTLSLLLGRTPREIFAGLQQIKPRLPEPIAVPALLPSKLLENRPDIVAAEEGLQAANFEIGVARAAYFPSLTLTGALGQQSLELKNLMDASARIWNVGGNLTAPLLDFGRISANVKITEARQQEALLRYAKTVKTAFKEAYDALAKIETGSNKLQAQSEEQQALDRVLTMATKKYEAGATNYLTVLDAQRGHLSSALNLTTLQTDVILNQIVLYKVLGGGWKRDYLGKEELR